MKVGRPKNIKDENEMYGYFLGYKEKVKSNPILVHEFKGKDATEVWYRKEAPLTFDGFQNYLQDQGIISDVTDYFENKEGRYSEFIRICSRIKREIRDDQIRGGMAGIYNPSITQRLNSLVDKSEKTVIKEQPLFGDDE